MSDSSVTASTYITVVVRARSGRRGQRNRLRAWAGCRQRIERISTDFRVLARG